VREAWEPVGGLAWSIKRASKFDFSHGISLAYHRYWYYDTIILTLSNVPKTHLGLININRDTYPPTYTPLETSSKLRIPLHTAMMLTPYSLLILLLQITTTTIAHPLTKRKGGGGGGGRSGGGGGTSTLSSGSISWKTVVAIVFSLLGAFLLLYIIYQCCTPGKRLHDWMEKVRDERSAKKRARNEAGDANASANGGRGKVEMGGV